ncbi:DUF4169 family protein [Methylovirgula sp. 4M-Z18]|uniref:DUF4169 family protein n=1 Tax=Methylovirgula sp. 4M-Z18 TaxID=2293567 RepID=UPI000E2F2606|nr:DUF4169 family protein [Methylovirgula sp. 4M-Z18]RFB79581.1 DUF4169 family protein [Methylovirgula sp. 4M-Z18]
MAEIVNLRRARKEKARQAKDEKAAQNRATFGRSKAEITLSKAQAALADRQLDGAKRDEP